MSGIHPSQGMRLPGAGQLLVMAAAAVAIWLIWSQSRERGWISGVAPRPVDAIEQGHKAEKFDSLQLPEVASLIGTLSNARDPAARRQALLQLSSIGPEAAEALDAIRDRLQDEQAGVRHAAVLTLWRVSQDPEVVMPALTAMLDDPADVVRNGATETLSTIGRPATGLVLDLLRSQSSRVRSEALLILQRIVCPETFTGISVAIENLVDDPTPGVRTAALIACVQFGSQDASKLRALLQTDFTAPALQPPPGNSRNSRDVALEAIGWRGPDAAEFVPDLVKLLEQQADFETKPGRPNAAPEVRDLTPRVQTILRILRDLKTAARPAIPILLARLSELDSKNRLVMIGTLIDIGAEPEMFTPQLIALLSKSDPNEDFWAWCRNAMPAGSLLVRTDPAEARRQVSLLIPKLADPKKPIDQVALHALMGLGQQAADAMPVLVSLLDRGGVNVFHAADVLQYLGPEAVPAVPRLVAILAQARTEGKVRDQRETIVALGRIGPEAAPAVPVLIAILEEAHRNGELQFQHEAFNALGNIGPAARTAVPLLLALLDETEAAAPSKIVSVHGGEYRINALLALGKLADDSPDVLAAICRQLKSNLTLRRVVAVYALARATRDTPFVVTQVVELLRTDKEGFVRAHTALAIAGMSGDRGPAIAPLSEALNDPDPEVRKMAAIALGSIGPEANPALPALRQAWLEARCGIPHAPSSGPSRYLFALRDKIQELPQLPLAQALRQAIKEIERAD